MSTATSPGTADSIIKYDDSKLHNSVQVAGEFSNWSHLDLLLKGQTEYSISIKNLNPGQQFMYKFIVDGQWLLASDGRETRSDEHGNLNHVLKVASVSPLSSNIVKAALPVYAEPAEPISAPSSSSSASTSSSTKPSSKSSSISEVSDVSEVPEVSKKSGLGNNKDDNEGDEREKLQLHPVTTYNTFGSAPTNSTTLNNDTSKPSSSSKPSAITSSVDKSSSVTGRPKAAKKDTTSKPQNAAAAVETSGTLSTRSVSNNDDSQSSPAKKPSSFWLTRLISAFFSGMSYYFKRVFGFGIGS